MFFMNTFSYCRGENEKVVVNVIIKVLPSNLGRRKTFRSLDFFENEIIFYHKVCD